MKFALRVVVILGLLLSTVAAAQQADGPLPEISYKFEKHEIPRHVLLHHLLFTVPTYLEDETMTKLLLEDLDLEDPRAASILLAAGNRYVDLVTGGHPMIVERRQEADGSTSVLEYGDSNAPGPPELAGLEGEAWAHANHQRELEEMRRLAEIYADLAQDLATVGLDISGIEAHLEVLRQSTTVTSDKPYREGSQSWEKNQVFERHLERKLAAQQR